MKLEDALISHISANAPGLVQGVSLFHSHMPAGIASGVLVMTRVPIEVGLYTGMRNGTFQVVCRDVSIPLAHDKASEIIKAISSEGVRVGTVNFRFIKPQHEPLVFPRTEGAQFEAAVNYIFAANWE